MKSVSHGLVALICLSLLLFSFVTINAQDTKVEEKKTDAKKEIKKEEGTMPTPGTDLTPGTYAEMKTSMGTIVIKLFTEKVPKTTENFIGLAEGTKEWTDPKTAKKVKKPFYDGLIFHRVIKDFMIQGGCPKGDGSGGPGYTINDEIVGLKHDKPGIVAMANRGPNTNGCQFYITVAPQPHLDKGYTIFGEVVRGMDVVNKISVVETGPMDRPIKPITIEKVTIVRIPEKLTIPGSIPSSAVHSVKDEQKPETKTQQTETKY